MALDQNEILQIKEIVREGIKEYFAESASVVDPKTHAKHHMALESCIQNRAEIDADHAFIREMREGVKTVKAASIKAVITGGLSAALALAWLYFQHKGSQ